MFEFLVANSLLDAPVIMVIVTIFALLSWWFTPEDAWLSKQHIIHILETPGQTDVNRLSKG